MGPFAIRGVEPTVAAEEAVGVAAVVDDVVVDNVVVVVDDVDVVVVVVDDAAVAASTLAVVVSYYKLHQIISLANKPVGGLVSNHQGGLELVHAVFLYFAYVVCYFF